MNRKKEDLLLVEKAVGGDQKAFTLLHNRYFPSIYQTIKKMVHNDDDAQDLTIEAIGKAFNNIKAYSPRYAFSTWIFRIAINNCIDHIRKQRLQYFSMDQPLEFGSRADFSETIGCGAPNPEQRFIRQQRLAMTRREIGKLNEKYRLMIELRFFEELSYDEIATILGIPLGTVKAQIFRAKELLSEQLQKPAAKAFLEQVPRQRKRA